MSGQRIIILGVFVLFLLIKSCISKFKVSVSHFQFFNFHYFVADSSLLVLYFHVESKTSQTSFFSIAIITTGQGGVRFHNFITVNFKM